MPPSRCGNRALLKGRSHKLLQLRAQQSAMYHDAKSRRFGRSRLDDCDLHRPACRRQHPAVGRAVPSVDRVVRPAAQRPGREVQPERRYGLQEKSVLAHDLGFGREVLARPPFLGPAVLLPIFLRAEPLCMAW